MLATSSRAQVTCLQFVTVLGILLFLRVTAGFAYDLRSLGGDTVPLMGSTSNTVNGMVERNTEVSPNLLARQRDLGRLLKGEGRTIKEVRHGNVKYCVMHGDRALWIVVQAEEGAGFAFCAVNDGGEDTRVVDVEELEDDCMRVRVHTQAGEYTSLIELPHGKQRVLHWSTSLRPSADLRLPISPRDIVPITKQGNPVGTAGVLHAAQNGITGNILFASLTEPFDEGRLTMLYAQNLGALTEFFERTKASGSSRVGGKWPEMGFELPSTTDQPLVHGKEYTLSDAYVCIEPASPASDIECAELFLNLYACLYLRFPKPNEVHRDWPRRVHETVRDLSHSPECGEDIGGNRYIYAYAGTSDRPPESMVQLAVLVPMLEYAEAHDINIPLAEAIKRNLPTFVDPKLDVIVRWLPLAHDRLQEQEEHMKPEVMDSWYLLHTYMNLARMATHGDTDARKLFFQSLDYAIRVAQRFDYQWPVFYDIYTLEVIKAETEPGKGGEQDVGALYAHVMLTAYDLTRDRKYIEEAKKATKFLRGLTFDLGYQFNNVSFGAGALFRLWKITGDPQYKGLSNICWANVVRNFWLWECDYGFGKHYDTFMGLAPLRDAEYLALYEELEVLAAIHEYLQAAGDEAPAPLRVLLPEYCRYLINRAWYHYPSELPVDVLATKPQSGNMHRYLSVPVEDLREGWAQAGQVGQEVYGAAAPFIIATRHCHRVPNENFILHCTYPLTKLQVKNSSKGGSAKFKFAGDGRCQTTIRIVAENYAPLPSFTVLQGGGKTGKSVEGKLEALGYIEYTLPGDAEVEVKWDKSQVFIGSSPLLKQKSASRQQKVPKPKKRSAVKAQKATKKSAKKRAKRK